MKLTSTRSPVVIDSPRHARRALRAQPKPSGSPTEGAGRRRRGDAVDGFDRSPMRALRHELTKLLKLLQQLTQQQPSPTPLPDPRLPDTFTPGPAGSSGGLGSTGAGSTGSTGGAPAGGGCSAANPFANGWPPASYGPGYKYAKADASLTWDQLAKLFAEGKVGANTGGSCGMSNEERVSSLRSYWDQCVKSGKSPAECGFNLLCSPTSPPAGVHYG